MKKPLSKRTITIAVTLTVVTTTLAFLDTAREFNPDYVHASTRTKQSMDTSQAVRYNPDGTVIGDIVYSFVNADDGVHKINAPFPINFYGTRLPALCLSLNGVVYPITSISDSCSPSYDKNLEALALQSKASILAPLALDLNFGSVSGFSSTRILQNPQILSTDELQIIELTSLNGTLTAKTNQPHGLLVGDVIVRDSANIDNNLIFSQFGGYLDNQITVVSVPAPDTFTFSKSGLTNTTWVPGANVRAVLPRLLNRARINNLSVSGTTLTISTQNLGNHVTKFSAGRKITLAGTGIPQLDNVKLTVASRVSDNNFTVTLPSPIADLDLNQAGSQTSVTYNSNYPWMLERDDAGAIQTVYAGSTSIDGKEAFVVTWYRGMNFEYLETGFPAANPRNLTITAQLVIIKESTGSDAAGWDFVYEFNIGHANDASDGYNVNSPNEQCNINFSFEPCRWGMGSAKYSAGASVSNISSNGTLLTINTSSPHGLTQGQFTALTNVSGLGINGLSDVFTVQHVVDADTVTVAYTASTFGSTSTPGATLAYAQAEELFPTTPSTQLIDSAGSTSLVRNSLNSRVLGRYTLAMSGGSVTNFVQPTMGNGISGVVPSEGAQAGMTVINVNPTKITVDNEIITILGANLNTVTEVYIGGIRVPIFTQSGNRLQVRAPKGLSGLVDLELKSTLNDVLMTKKLNFGGTAVGTRKATLIVGGFAHNSRKLTARMQARIDRWLERNSDLSTLTCTGFTSLPRRTTDVTLSTNRGITACNFSKKQRSELKTSVSQGIEDPRPGSKVRRVRLVLTP